MKPAHHPVSLSPHSFPLLPWGPGDAGAWLVFYVGFVIFQELWGQHKDTITTEQIVCYSSPVEGVHHTMQNHKEKHQGQSVGRGIEGNMS